MNTIEAIRTRRSVREYGPEAVPPEVVRDMLVAAMHAPSADNEQPWQFVVIDDRGLLREVTRIHPWARMAAHAPLAVLVCGDGREIQNEQYWEQDCSAATQNLLLAAWEHGVGSVWTGIDASWRPAFRSLLKLPEAVLPFALVVLGYPARPVPPADRYREDRVHSNGW